MKRVHFLARTVFLLFAVVLLFSVGSLSAAAASGEIPTVSYGLGVLSARMDMAVSAPVGNDVTFCADDFARALNLARVEYVRVHSLPSAAAGELLLGSSRVAAGQTVSADNLSYLNFILRVKRSGGTVRDFSSSPRRQVCLRVGAFYFVNIRKDIKL